MTDDVALNANGCHNCAGGSETVAMLMLRCANPESPKCGELVELDHCCAAWAAKKEGK